MDRFGNYAPTTAEFVMDPFVFETILEDAATEKLQNKTRESVNGSLEQLNKFLTKRHDDQIYHRTNTQSNNPLHMPKIPIDASSHSKEEFTVEIDSSQKSCLPVLGNYCGPYYSAGKIQQSVVSDVPACSDADLACKIHDTCYASGQDHQQCDYEFINNPDAYTFMKGLVGVQAVARSLYPEMTNLRKNIDKSKNKKDEKKNSSSNRTPMNGSSRIVSAPNALSISNLNKRNAPKMTTTKRGMFINHSELISGVFLGAGAPTAYNAVKFSVNPGKFSTFPWLATVATNYDKYVFRKLRLIYMPLVSTSTGGRVGICFDYDSSDATPNTRADFFNSTRHSESAVWAPLELNVPVDKVERFTNTHTSTDSKLIDLGSFSYMTDASTAAASSSVGDLICEYEVELLRPQPPSYSTMCVSLTNFSGTDLSSYLSGPSLGNFYVYSATEIDIAGLSPGNYFITTYINDSAAATPTLAISAANGTITTTKSLGNTTDYFKICSLSVPAGNGRVSFTVGGAADYSALEKCQIRISKIDSGIPTLW